LNPFDANISIRRPSENPAVSDSLPSSVMVAMVLMVAVMSVMMTMVEGFVVVTMLDVVSMIDVG